MFYRSYLYKFQQVLINEFKPAWNMLHLNSTIASSKCLNFLFHLKQFYNEPFFIDKSSHSLPIFSAHPKMFKFGGHRFVGVFHYVADAFPPAKSRVPLFEQ